MGNVDSTSDVAASEDVDAASASGGTCLQFLMSLLLIFSLMMNLVLFRIFISPPPFLCRWNVDQELAFQFPEERTQKAPVVQVRRLQHLRGMTLIP